MADPTASYQRFLSCRQDPKPRFNSEPDTRPNEELERRFINDVFQDVVQLKDADVPTVRKYFND